MESIHERIRRSDGFVLYYPLGSVVGEYHQAAACAEAIVVHPNPERLMVRGLAGGRETFRLRGDEFGMTIFD
jgi:hypothetical protein